MLQPLTFFESDVQPITVVVMLDTSGSMTLNLELLKHGGRAVRAAAAARRPRAHRQLLGQDHHQPDVHGRSRRARSAFIHNEIQFGNPTHLWDAIDASMTALSREDRAAASCSSSPTARTCTAGRRRFDDVLARAQKEEFMIYAIGLQSFVPGQRPTRPDRGLRTARRRDRRRLLRAQEHRRPRADVHARRRRAAPAVRARVLAGHARRQTAQDRRAHQGAGHDGPRAEVVRRVEAGRRIGLASEVQAS